MADMAQGRLTVAELQETVRRFRDERDWLRFHTLKDLAAAIAIEAGELQQEPLWARPDEEDARLAEHRDRIEQELADVAILALNSRTPAASMSRAPSRRS